MKVLILTSSFPRHAGDVAGTFVAEHAKVVAEAGHDVHVMTWDAQTPTTYTPEGLRVSRVRYAPRRAQMLFYRAGAPENLGAAPWLAALVGPSATTMFARASVAAVDADVIVGHWLLPGGLIARALGKVFAKPSLVIGHSGGVHALARLPGFIGREAARFMAEGALTFPTHALREKFESVAGSRCGATILPMGCVDPMVEAEGEDWLVLSRLVPIKNLELAIRAFVASGSAARLQVAGDGPERGRLEALAHSLSADVVFHGWVEGEKKRRLLAESGFFLMTSRVEKGRHEGLPVGLLEAQAAGLIPLVADTPGMVDAVYSHDALVSGTRVETWATAIARAEAGPHAREAVRSFGRSRTWSALGPTWVELLEAVAMTGRERHVV